MTPDPDADPAPDPGPGPGRTAAAQAALARVVDRWMARAEVISVEVARQWRDGAPTDQVVVRVTVDRLPTADAEGEALPSSIDGVPVEVVEGRPPRLEA